MIHVHELGRWYGSFAALAGVSFSAVRGEIVGILGGNGAGKSTLFACLLGLAPYDGRVRVDGLDPLSDGRGVRRRVGYLPQSPGLHLDLTVDETLRFYAALRGVDAERGRELAAELGLAGRRGDRVGELSGGMRQRLGLAVALLGDPPVLLLDEPTASLDRAGRGFLAHRLARLAGEGRTVLVSTHARDDVLEAVHRTLVLEEGRLVAAPSCPPASSRAGAPGLAALGGAA